MTVTAKNRELIRAKARWSAARKRTWDARFDMNQAIREAYAQGMSQSEIARVLEWPRQRVHTLLED